MNQIRIELPLALVSENAALRCIVRGRYASPTKSQKIKDFENEFQKLIEPFRNEIKAFEASHDASKQGIELTILHKTPKFLTKKGTISDNSIDTDNIKYAIDIMFKNFENLKDSQVIALHSYKCHAEKHSILLVLKSIPNNFIMEI